MPKRILLRIFSGLSAAASLAVGYLVAWLDRFTANGQGFHHWAAAPNLTLSFGLLILAAALLLCSLED